MIKSPENAGAAWCPFARQEGEAATYNRWSKGEAGNNCYCLASGCMAWRWHDRDGAGPQGWNWQRVHVLRSPWNDADAEAAGIAKSPEGYFLDEEPQRPEGLTPRHIWRSLSDTEGEWCGWEIEPTDEERRAGRRGYCGLAGAMGPGGAE